MNYDYIIIGGGIAGLEMAALCSKLGKVALFEKNSHLGGRAKVVEKNGFFLDWGPHPIRFGKRSSIATTLKEVGINDMKYINPGILTAYLKDGQKHIFPSGVKGILKTKMVSQLKLVSLIIKLFKQLKRYPNKLYNMSFNQYFDEFNVDERIKIFLHMASASMMVNPYLERSSVGEFAENMFEILKKKSVFYPKGGWNKIFNGLKEIIEKNNGIIKLNTKIDKIIIENGLAIGVKIGEKSHFGKKIISTIPVQSLDEVIDNNNNNKKIDAFIEKCNNLRPTAGIVIDYCLSEKISDETLMFLEQPPSFGIIASNLDPNIAPPNKSLMSFFLPVDHEIMKNRGQIDELYVVFKNKINEIYPKIKNCTEFERPLFLNMVDGVEIAVDQNRINRPKPEGINIKNLYLTGDSIGGWGAGGDIGHNSVRECFDRILKSEN